MYEKESTLDNFLLLRDCFSGASSNPWHASVNQQIEGEVALDPAAARHMSRTTAQDPSQSSCLQQHQYLFSRIPAAYPAAAPGHGASGLASWVSRRTQTEAENRMHQYSRCVVAPFTWPSAPAPACRRRQASVVSVELRVSLTRACTYKAYERTLRPAVKPAL